MNTEINLHQILQDSFLNAGYLVEKSDFGVTVGAIGLLIAAKVLEADKIEGGNGPVVLSVSCIHSEKIPNGITETATGLAENRESAIRQALDNWILSDFIPIHDFLCSSGNLLGGYAETVSYSDDVDKIVGWDLYFGPRLEASQNKNIIEVSENKREQTQIHQILFQAMTDSLFGTPGLYYIRIFMSKINNSQIECDCRVNGYDWEHGKNYLTNYISKYQSNPGVFWIKQNVLLVSKPADEIKSSQLLENLRNELSKQKQTESKVPKKWWKFWE